jgi:hypothetical protein
MLKHRLKNVQCVFLNNVHKIFAEYFCTKHVLLKMVVFINFNNLTLLNHA